MLLFNSLSRQKERFQPRHPGQVTLYTCGPTVYDYAHIGNFRTYVFEDLLRRTLHYFDFKVTQAMNLTDVDDKTIRGAIRKNISLDSYTQPFKEAFFSDLKTLNIEPVEFYPQATDYIQEMIRLIEILLEKKIAYRTAEGSIYYSIKQFPHYGALSHLSQEELLPGARTSDADEYDKESASDFALWKAYDPTRDGQVFWDSPFGKGRPGWHIECSAMAMKLLGEQIDIHVGGVDNLFPHHENEIAQSQGCTGKTFVTYWLHVEHLLVDHKKMSKSLGNFYTLRDLTLKGFSGRQVRYLLLQTHYRTQLNFTFAGLEAAKATLDRLDAFITRLRSEPFPDSEPSTEAELSLRTAQERFSAALQDDLNISLALAALFDFVKEVNTRIDQKKWGQKEAAAALTWLKRIDSVLGCLFYQEETFIPDHLTELLQAREQARKEKNWAYADQLRDQILKEGFVIEDTPQGARLKKNG